MPRYLEFDRAAALDQAMLQFWNAGYADTSIQKLLQVMNINRGSLYAEFGDKQALFLEVLKRYEEMTLLMIDGLLNDASDLETCLMGFFESMYLCLDLEQKKPGCLMLKTLVHESFNQPQFAEISAGFFNKVKSRLVNLFSEAQELKALSKDKDPTALAHFFMNNIHGLRVSTQQNMKHQDLKVVVDTLLLTLR